MTIEFAPEGWMEAGQEELSVRGDREESVKSKCVEMWENLGVLGEERVVVHVFLSVTCGPWASHLCPQTSYWYRSWFSEGADESNFTILGGVWGGDDSVTLWRLDPGKTSGSVMTDDLAWS